MKLFLWNDPSNHASRGRKITRANLPLTWPAASHPHHSFSTPSLIPVRTNWLTKRVSVSSRTTKLALDGVSPMVNNKCLGSENGSHGNQFNIVMFWNGYKIIESFDHFYPLQKILNQEFFSTLHKLRTSLYST